MKKGEVICVDRKGRIGDKKYDLDDFTEARTHDPLWNAAQRQLSREGRMYNYLRMPWGKKVLQAPRMRRRSSWNSTTVTPWTAAIPIP